MDYCKNVIDLHSSRLSHKLSAIISLLNLAKKALTKAAPFLIFFFKQSHIKNASFKRGFCCVRFLFHKRLYFT